jgi:hypothetical protein
LHLCITKTAKHRALKFVRILFSVESIGSLAFMKILEMHILLVRKPKRKRPLGR